VREIDRRADGRQDRDVCERRRAPFRLHDVAREGDHLIHTRSQIFEDVARSALLLISEALERKTAFGVRTIGAPLIAVVVNAANERRVGGEFDEAGIHALRLLASLEEQRRCRAGFQEISRNHVRGVAESARHSPQER
jgi:hypothetical protein